MSHSPFFRLPVGLLALLAMGVQAQVQQAHVHGLAYVDLAVEGERIEIHLRATAHDLVGFERAPMNAEEEARLLLARKTVLDHAALWQFNAAANCVADTPTLKVPGMDGKARDHDHDHAHDHDHDHDHDHQHADWTARYAFRCANPTSLRAIDSGLFERFPSLQTVKVQIVDARGARGETLTPTARRITLVP